MNTENKAKDVARKATILTLAALTAILVGVVADGAMQNADKPHATSVAATPFEPAHRVHVATQATNAGTVPDNYQAPKPFLPPGVIASLDKLKPLHWTDKRSFKQWSRHAIDTSDASASLRKLPSAERYWVISHTIKAPLFQKRFKAYADNTSENNWTLKEISLYHKLAREDYGTTASRKDQHRSTDYTIKSLSLDAAGISVGLHFQYCIIGFTKRFEYERRHPAAVSAPHISTWRAVSAARKTNIRRLAVKYGNQIAIQVRTKWNPAVSRAPTSVRIELHMNRLGFVTGLPIIVKSNTTKGSDTALIDAIEEAEPFTPPAGLPYKEYSVVHIVFTTQGLSGNQPYQQIDGDHPY